MRFVEDQPSPRVVFERGAAMRVAEEALALGASRIVVVATRSAAEIASDLCRRLADAVVGRVTDVEQHVPARRAHQLRELASDVEADLLLAIGGGSAIGLAKAAALISAVPILAVPTTYSGSEMTPIWGMTSGGRKLTGRSPRAVPRTVVYDPQLTLGLPPRLTATSGLNAVAHCVEALYSPAATPMSSAIAGEAVALLARGLPAAVAAPGDVDARERCQAGACLAGSALARTTMGIHHRLCHALGGMTGVDHAGVHAVLLPHVAAFNAGSAPDAMGRVAQALGVDDPVEGLFALAAAVGAPRRLSELGVPERSLGEVADASVDRPIRQPRPVSRWQALDILRSAWQGRASTPGAVASRR